MVGQIKIWIAGVIHHELPETTESELNSIFVRKKVHIDTNQLIFIERVLILLDKQKCM